MSGAIGIRTDRRRTIATALSAVALLRAQYVAAEPIHGRIQLQYAYAEADADSVAALVDVRQRSDWLGDMRITWSPRVDEWSLDTAYVLAFDAGDTPYLTARESGLGILPSAPTGTLWDLTNTFTNRPHLTGSQAIDRLAVGYANEHWVGRIGRQALTWGAGLVFHPMDLFDPFAPDATDTEYKPGTDMLYGQYLFDSGADLQVVVVPRRSRTSGDITGDASSFALHLHATIKSLQTTWLVARDHGDVVAAIGVNGALGGATWNAEVIPTIMQDHGTYTSALVNLSTGEQVWHRDATWFAEYYRNGFGSSRSRYSLADLPTPLLDRLLRGQVFNTGRDYLAGGVQLQWTPLLQLSPTFIVNLNDTSCYFVGQGTYSLTDNLNVIVGVEIPTGGKHTEFGGVPLASNSNTYLEQPMRAYVQLRGYF